MSSEENAPSELRSFGRRRGRKLSERQASLMDTLLPRVAVPVGEQSSCSREQLNGLFGGSAPPVWLEIGFGGGEHLLWQARSNPDVGFIGAEPFIDGVVKVLDGIDAAQLSNVRLHADDARPLLRWLPEQSIDRAFVLFPDPWPKKRHVKRRLINPEFLGLLARVMVPGGELRIGSDIPDYIRTILLSVHKCSDFEWRARRPADWQRRPDDWPKTRYEAKAVREGRRSTYLGFRRR